ncbi:BMP family lipoprotein [Clostridium lundense]|uniref:BMP family lipoprotein n=1 Tax=Clostridium lundense TaxID=319475 RepID=UPI000482D4E8|nr:BMP family ABC transporter substrate-binding protein [Clostridium lundense]
MKKVKSIFAMLLVLIFALSIVGCGGKKEEPKKGASDNKKVKVALICSQGGLGDRSYNDSGYFGLEKASKELGVDIKVVEPKDVSEGEKYLTELAKAGYNLVMTLEYSHADILKNVAPQFPDTRFAIFNIEVDQPNVTSVIFKEHEGSYLAGALAAMVTKDAKVQGMNDKKVIGFVGGIDSPGINKFLVGYKEGAQSIDKDVKVLSGYTNSFGDPGKGKEMALSQIEQGADVVYQVAGGTGEGVISAAKDKNVFAIGVDSDQDYIAKGNVLTSMMKRTDVAVYDLVKALKDGKISDMKTLSLGLKENGVQLSSMQFTKGKIPAEYLTKIEQIKKDIIDGKIKVTDVTQK